MVEVGIHAMNSIKEDYGTAKRVQYAVFMAEKPSTKYVIMQKPCDLRTGAGINSYSTELKSKTFCFQDERYTDYGWLHLIMVRRSPDKIALKKSDNWWPAKRTLKNRVPTCVISTSITSVSLRRSHM